MTWLNLVRRAFGKQRYCCRAHPEITDWHKPGSLYHGSERWLWLPKALGRIREFVLSGATAELLDDHRLPVVMSQ